MSRRARRAAALVALGIFIPLQIHATFIQGDGGFVGEYGLLQAFVEFFENSLDDPILTAGLIDFAVVGFVLAAWMISELPARRRWNGKTLVWLLSYCVFPGLGALLYLLWLNPDHRLMQGPEVRRLTNP
ncbi:MAG: hypothetical protein ACRD0O_10915 [Acidimicrobiia bacterium]